MMAIATGNQMEETEMEPKNKLLILESDELVIGNCLSANQYAELILGYLVQGLNVQAKNCYKRAAERYEDEPLIKQIWIFGHHICKENLQVALNKCKATEITDQSLKIYIDELLQRLLAEQLKLIADTYSSINVQKFKELIGSPSDEELTVLLQNCMWTQTNDSFVIPGQNAHFTVTLDKFYDPKFGAYFGDGGNRNKDSEAQMGQQNIENLTSLVNCSNFFDALLANNAACGKAKNVCDMNNPSN